MTIPAATFVVPMWRRTTLQLVGLMCVVALWAAVASTQLTVLVPSPAETVAAVINLCRGPLWSELARTTWRAVQGTGAAIVIGVAIGLCTGFSELLTALLSATRSILTGIPPIITVVLVSIWVGFDGDSTPFVVAASSMPMIWITTTEAVRAVDPELNEMAAGLHLGRVWKLRNVTLPAISSPVGAVALYTAAASFRLTIMAELIAEPDGIGARIARARTMLNTTEVFAWALITIITAVVLQLGFERVGPKGTRRLREVDPLRR